MAGSNLTQPGNVNVKPLAQTLSEVIRKAIEARLLETNTLIPGVVTAVKTNNRVDVQPTIKKYFPTEGEAKTLPIIPDVVVQTPRGAGYGIKLPIAVGDLGSILFSSKSLDVWSASDGINPVDPQDSRHHSLSDGIFIPGLYPFTNPIPAPMAADPSTLVVYNGAAQFYLQTQGGFKLTNGVTEVLRILLDTMQQLQQALTELSLTTVTTLLGPEPLSSAAALAANSAQVAALIIELEPLVGT